MLIDDDDDDDANPCHGTEAADPAKFLQYP